MNIFVHCASEYLTDHEPHGEGLICFSLLNGLAERGHTIFAYTLRAAIRNSCPRLHVRTQTHHIPLNSLAFWEHSLLSDRWLSELRETCSIDVVWRMNPCYEGCPLPPTTFGLPFVLGPVYYKWPDSSSRARPRLGVGVNSIVKPMGLSGWRRTLRMADHIFCATPGHAHAMQVEAPQARVTPLPVIVDPPNSSRDLERHAPSSEEPVIVAFAANIEPNKHPRIFCDAVALLRRAGIPAVGIVLGDGRDRKSLQLYCSDIGVGDSIQFLGKVPNADVYDRLAGAHFLLSASLGEPYGRSIAEAMSVGTPPVCHRSGGPSEFIEDGVDGILVDRLEPRLYAERIAELLSDRSRWKSMSMSCSKKASEWSSGRVLDGVEETLMSICDRQTGATITAGSVN
jgi:glycosyltransferase involved in cell wall biosynthesis